MDDLPPKQRRKAKKNENSPPKQGIFTRILIISSMDIYDALT